MRFGGDATGQRPVSVSALRLPSDDRFPQFLSRN